MKQGSKNNAVVGIVAVVIIGMIIAGTIFLKPKDSTTDSMGSSSTADSSSSSTSDTSNNSTADTSSTGSSSSGTYKDGTYTAKGDFSTPGGNEEITVTITISNGAISSSSVTGDVTSRESKEYLQDFKDQYEESVSGKSVATLRLSRIAGASLTTRGFNNALDAIRNQAQS